MPLKQTPDSARRLLLIGVFLIALPSIASLYEGSTGKFLVATGVISSGPFKNTVIYLQGHSVWGAHGVIINWPVPSKDFRDPFPELAWNIDLYNGGPVFYGDHVQVLLEDKEALNGFQIVGTQTLQKTRPDVYEVLEQGTNETPVRLYTGYAGWGILQLNREIVRGGWGVIEYDENLMFNTPAEEIWTQAIERVLKDRPAASGGV